VRFLAHAARTPEAILKMRARLRRAMLAVGRMLRQVLMGRSVPAASDVDLAAFRWPAARGLELTAAELFNSSTVADLDQAIPLSSDGQQP